jgi:peptidyl-prolyl cis-trans isomerase SurA
MRRTQRPISAAIALGLLLITSAPNNAEATVIDRVVAVINNEAITLSDLNRNWIASRNLPGAPLDRDTLLTQMVERVLLSQRAVALNIAATGPDIQDALAGVMGENNITSFDALDAALAEEGRDITDLEEDLTYQINQYRLIQREVVPQVRLSQEELKAFYRDNPGAFSQSERIRVRQIHITQEADSANPAETEAVAKLWKQVNNRESFLKAEEALKGTHGIAVGEIGEFGRGELMPALDAVLFALPEGGVSDPVTLPTGTAIFLLDEISGGTVPPFDQVQDQVRTLAVQSHTGQVLKTWLGELKGNAHIEIHDLGPDPT